MFLENGYSWWKMPQLYIFMPLSNICQFEGLFGSHQNLHLKSESKAHPNDLLLYRKWIGCSNMERGREEEREKSIADHQNDNSFARELPVSKAGCTIYS